MKEKIHVNSIFISDIHLGTKMCRAKELRSFLEKYETKNLYLLGDIIDLWSLKRSFYFPVEHIKIINIINKASKNGANVVFVPGNHDSEFRELHGEYFGNIQILNETEYTSINGDVFRLIHGDIADIIIQKNIWLAKFGSKLYDTSMYLNRIINVVRKFFGLEYYPVSKKLKEFVKQSGTYISSFENEIIKQSKKNDHLVHQNGVICGHIHFPIIKTIENDYIYMNCGDWCENCSAIIEDKEGNFRIEKQEVKYL